MSLVQFQGEKKHRSVDECEKERERNKSLGELDRAKRERDKDKAERTEQIERLETRNRQGKKSAEEGGMPKILIGARTRKPQAITGKVDASTMEIANTKVKAAYEAFNENKIDPIM